MFGIEIPYSHGIIVAGGEEVVVFGVYHELGDGVCVALEHFYYSVLVDRPIID